MRVITQAASTMNTHELEAFKRKMIKEIGHDDQPAA
jgi:hypothetical protein